MNPSSSYPLIWRVKTRLPERKGQACRVICESLRMNSVLVEFHDGTRVVTSANFVRPPKKTPLFG